GSGRLVTRLDTPPSSHRHHPDSAIALAHRIALASTIEVSVRSFDGALQNGDRDGDEVWLLERAEIIVAFRLEAGAAMNGIVRSTAPAEPRFALSHDAWRSWNKPEKLASADAEEQGQTPGWCPGAESNHRHCDFQAQVTSFISGP
ncbi:hypothetical protein, partial [Bradyrhizobium liaoningense]|uniref:hypothetical protein n=1 Tax=Bradyrhizobium liaoningense TaxID=43992 RepID=UPI001BADF44C